MTTEQPDAQRLLRRRSEDRVIGGVSSGLGAYLNVDPLLLRIAFVGLMVFGGLGLVLYVLAWGFVPDETTHDSIVEQGLHRLNLSMQRVLIAVLLVLGGVLFVSGVGGFAGALIAGLAVVVLGAFLLRHEERGRGVDPHPDPAGIAASRPVAPLAAERVARHRAPKVRSPLSWYLLAGMLVAIGALATITNIWGTDVDLGQFFGVSLGVLGVGLVIGTWWGHARRLIILGLFILPFAVASSFVTAPIAGGFGEHEFRPANVDELRGGYRLVGGRMVLDLTALEGAREPVVIAASVAFGQLKVILPEGASIRLDADVGAGELGILGAWQTGTGLADRYVRDASGPQFILEVEVGIGSAWVDGQTVGGQ